MIVKGFLLACFVTLARTQTDQELSEATENIWAVDDNSFTDDEIDYDLGSSGRLFLYVNESRLETGTYPSMRVMLELFNPYIGQPDPDIDNEIELFLFELLKTEPMLVAYQYLLDWGLADSDFEVFREDLKVMWFGLYSRATDDTLDSSGFQHVFQGQISESNFDVVGFHNWVQTYQEELKGAFQYDDGYAECGNELVGISDFVWRGAKKPLSSMWIGTSPEVEIALYTVCHLARRDQSCNFTIADGMNTTITTYAWEDTELISTGYPRCSFVLSDDELGEVTEAIYRADTNSFTSDEIEYDMEGDELFVYVDESRFATGVYPSFISLLEKFNPMIGVDDPDLQEDIEAFLDVLLGTDVMMLTQQYLADWGRVSEDPLTWRNEVREYWFGRYSRSQETALDSSGFEHAFQGQIREGGAEVTGFNNWVQTYKEEMNGNFTYGFSGADCEDDLIQINDFTWLGAVKPISSIWIGASPELEIALYTLCFNVRRNEDCNIMIDGHQEKIIQYEITGTDYIGSAYMIC